MAIETCRTRRQSALLPSDIVTLPVGIQRPGDPCRYREVRIDEMCGKDEENLAKLKTRRNVPLAVTVLLQRCIQEIPGLMAPKQGPYVLIEKQYVRDWMTQVDRDFLLVAIMVLSGQDRTEVRVACEKCSEEIVEKVQYSDLAVYDWPEDQPLTVEGELLRGYTDRAGVLHKKVIVTMPSGTVQEMVLQQSRGNKGEASTLLIASCVKFTDSDAMDSDIASRLKTADRQYIGRLYGDAFPGIQVVRKVNCGDCGHEQECPVDLSGFFGQDKSRSK